MTDPGVPPGFIFHPHCPSTALLHSDPVQRLLQIRNEILVVLNAH